MTATNNGLYGPLTKSIDIDESLALIALANEYEQVDAWQEEALSACRRLRAADGRKLCGLCGANF